MVFTAVCSEARVNARGTKISMAAGEDMSLDDYRLYVDVPCRITIEPLPMPVDGEAFELDGDEL